MEKESKLYRLLETCTGYELRRFRVFLASPFFNLRSEIIAVWDFLRPHFPATGLPLPSAESVYQVAFPALSFDMGRLRHLLSDL
jgi:hypothetical protein